MGSGDGKEFSLPPAWAQNFRQKHPPTPYCSETSGLAQPGHSATSSCCPWGRLEQTRVRIHAPLLTHTP